MGKINPGPIAAREGDYLHVSRHPSAPPRPPTPHRPRGLGLSRLAGGGLSPGLKGADRLTFLATLFTAMEINVTFYRPIPPYARRWLAAVDQNPDFRFTAKVWQVFTHERRLPKPELAQFQEGLEPLLAAGTLGVLLAQFPYSFHNTKENRAYLLELKAAFPDFPLAVEVRHRSWQHRAVKEFLAQARLDFCNIDQPLVSYPMGATRWVTGPGATCAATAGGKTPGLSSGTTGEPGTTTCTPPKNWRIWRPGPGNWL